MFPSLWNQHTNLPRFTECALVFAKFLHLLFFSHTQSKQFCIAEYRPLLQNMNFLVGSRFRPELFRLRTEAPQHQTTITPPFDMNDNDNEEKILLNNYRPLLINDKISENTSLLYIMKC